MQKLKKFSRDPQFNKKLSPRYFLTTIRIKEPESHDRCIGYYTTLSDARGIIHDNAESLCEAGYYQYAVIEAFGPGWYPTAQIEEWYEFAKSGKSARKIRKPKAYANICNFGIG